MKTELAIDTDLKILEQFVCNEIKRYYGAVLVDAVLGGNFFTLGHIKFLHFSINCMMFRTYIRFTIGNKLSKIDTTAVTSGLEN